MKIVVFDLDETLGYFVEFGIFWDCLQRYLVKTDKYILNQDDFNRILNLYPEFLRPNITDLLNYLKQKKQTKKCEKIMIYTNNQGTPKWSNHLKNYFETIMNYPLFDQIISAFKINGKRIEIGRTSHEKSYDDLIRCTKLPLNAEICFIDDNYFPEMYNKNVYYINVKPYVYDLPFEEMITRFLDTEQIKTIKLDITNSDLNTFMMNEYNLYHYTITEKKMDEYEVDKIISKQILIHLNDFFNKSIKSRIKKTKTKRIYQTKKNKTHKNYFQ